MMEAVVQGGTGKNVYVPGGRVAGKTGTSQKLSAAAGTGYIASFCCFAPANDPVAAILIAVDDPQGLTGGGAVAAPPCAEIMQDILTYKNVQMQYTEEEKIKLGGPVPKYSGMGVDAAKTQAEKDGLKLKVKGGGNFVVRQLPEVGTIIAPGGTVILYTENQADETIRVPDLTGRSIAEANRIAADAGLNIQFSGNFSSAALITSKQSIEAGKTVPAGTIITVHFVSKTDTADYVDD
jgi:stage V sporulation protein D (sporulation-specific penicillin-binding protein)